MESIVQNIVFRQYLSMLPQNVLACPLFNYDYKKLTEYSLVNSIILTNLFRWESLRDMEERIRSKVEIQKEFNLDSISPSQLSRRLAVLDADIVRLTGKD